MRGQRQAVGHVLAAAMSGRTLEPHLRSLLNAPDEAAIRRVLVAASRHGVSGFLAHALLPLPELDQGLRQQLDRVRSRVLRDHLRVLSELGTLAPALDDLGAPWLLLKGPALAAAAYSEPHLREYVDLDVLVPREALYDALRRLREVGCQVVDRSWVDLERERAGEVRLMSPAGVLIDLHWELFNDWRVRRDFRVPPTLDLLRRARTVDLDGSRLRTLHPVDTALHVALHAGTSGGWRLLWLSDVRQTLLCLDGAGDELAQAARSWQAALVLAVMSRRAQRVLGPPGAPLTDSALDNGAWWLRLVDVVEGLSPVERATGGGSALRIVTRSTRQTTPRSGVELLRRCAALAQSAGAGRTRAGRATLTRL